MTWEEVEKIITENNLSEQVAVWAAGTEKGKELLNNYSTVKVEEAVNARTREIHEGYDKDLQELGIDKAGRKTYQAIKDELANKMELANKVAELQEQLEKGQAPDERLTAQITALQEALQGKDNEVNQLKSEAVDFRKRMTFEGAMKGLNFDERHDKTLIETYKTVALQELMSNSELTENGLVIKDAQGQVMLNNEHRPMDANEALASKFSGLLKEAKPKGLGADGNPSGGKRANLSVTVDTSSLANLNGLKKKTEATNVLRKAYSEAGLDVNSEQFTKDYVLLTEE